MENWHLGTLPRGADPGRDRETERLQHQRRRLRHHAIAEKPDAAFLGSDDPGPTPFPIGLGHLVPRHVAMQPQHVHDDVFGQDRKSTRLNSSHVSISYAVFCLKKKKTKKYINK